MAAANLQAQPIERDFAVISSISARGAVTHNPSNIAISDATREADG